MTPANSVSASNWGGVLIIGNRRILFAGAAGTAKDQNIHALKICLALSGDFLLSTSSGVRDKPCSAVIINAGVTHTIECRNAKILLIYFLPETREARGLRAEYLYDGRGEFYDIPRELIEESLPVQRLLRNSPKWTCQDVFKVCDRVVAELMKIRRRQLSPSASFSLCDQLGKNVKRTIEYIYDELENQILRGKFNEERFTPSAIGKKLGLDEDKTKQLKSTFRKEAGISIEHYFRELQMLAALKLYAAKEWFRKTQEAELLTALANPMLTKEERDAIGEKLDALPRGVYLKEIAELLGFRSQALFNIRIKSRLGISIADLKGSTDFHSCLEQVHDEKYA
jgi:AraC-like DNA-binding protein